MNPFVLNAVVKNSWIGSGHDYSHSVKPVRVSKPGGVTYTVKVARRIYEPPVTNYDIPLFHYYQLGQLPPFLFEIYNLEKDAWVRSDKIMADNDVLIQMVAENGMSLTPRDIWLRRTAIDNNFIVAIFQNPAFDYGTTVPKLRQESKDGLVTTEEGFGIPVAYSQYEPVTIDEIHFTLHFYSNSNYFKAERRAEAGAAKMMSYKTANPKNLAEVSSFLADFKDNKSLGWVNGNGYIYTLASALANKEEFVAKELAVYEDHTIEEKILFPLRNALRYFNEKTKIFNQCFRLANGGIINRHDISAFVGTGEMDTFKGISLDIDTVTILKQITNVEVSIDSLAVLMSKHKFIARSNDIKILFVLRRGGAKRETPYSRLRLDLFDQLTITQRNQILTQQIDFPLWGIENLHKSAPNEFLYSRGTDLNDRLILDNYGLTGIVQLVAKNPIPLKQEYEEDRHFQTATVDWAYREELHYRKSQLYLEILPYGIEGELLKTSYRPANFAGRLSFEYLPDAKYVEVNLVKWYKNVIEYQTKLAGDVTLSDDGVFFGYGCYITDNIDTGAWTLAKENEHYVVVLNGKKKTIVWDTILLDSLGLVGRVVEGGKHIHVITYFNSHNQRKDFAEINVGLDVDGKPGIPPASIDVWMDDLLLIEGVDYVVHGTKIFVFLVGKSKQSQIRIRMSGISPTGKHLPPLQVGWVNSGQIFFGKDLRVLKNKQLQITIGGRMYHRDEVGFSGTSQATSNVRQGEPYMVKQFYPCLENFMNVSTVDEWLKEREIEKTVVDFMEEISPVVDTISFSRIAMTGSRKVVSGFMNAIVFDFLNIERYLRDNLKLPYTKADTDVWLAPHLYLIEVDPTQQSVFNATHMIVAPHREPYVSLSATQLEFLRFVNETYLNGRVTLDDYIITT